MISLTDRHPASTVTEGCTGLSCDNNADLKTKGMFLADYASSLLGCGATCIRIERNVNRMAKALACIAEISIMPRHIHFTISTCDRSETFTYICSTRKSAISFNINTRLSRLSWELADGKIDFRQACSEFKSIMNTAPENKHIVLLLASLANASFCRLFGGDFMAMLTVLLATMAGFHIRQLLINRTDIKLIFFICAFISSVLASGACIFCIGNTPRIAVATSVLYLVPGIPFLNSFSDLLAGHYICSICRFTDAVILTCCLSAGLCAGLLVMNLEMF